MKATEIGFVVFRIGGVFVLIWGLLGLVSSLSILAYGGLQNANVGWIATTQLLAYLVALGLAAYVFVSARKVSSWLLGSADDLDVGGSLQSVQAVAFSVVGVVFVLAALPGLGVTLAQLFWALRAGAELEREGFFNTERTFDVIHNGLSLAAGALLFVKARWLARRWSDAQR